MASPVVRREDDDGVVQLVDLLDGRDDPADRVVHLEQRVAEISARA